MEVRGASLVRTPLRGRRSGIPPLSFMAVQNICHKENIREKVGEFLFHKTVRLFLDGGQLFLLVEKTTVDFFQPSSSLRTSSLVPWTLLINRV